MVKIELKKEVLKDADGVELKIDGDIQYKQFDLVVLKSVMDLFDSSKFQFSDYSLCLGVIDKLRDVKDEENSFIEITLDEAKFLKDFLTNLDTKGLQAQLKETHMRTIINVVKQLEG